MTVRAADITQECGEDGVLNGVEGGSEGKQGGGERGGGGSRRMLLLLQLIQKGPQVCMISRF